MLYIPLQASEFQCPTPTIPEKTRYMKFSLGKNDGRQATVSLQAIAKVDAMLKNLFLL